MLSGSATFRFLASFSNVFLSLVLGVIAMGFFFIYYPDELNTGLRLASTLKEWLVAHVGSSRAESILRFLLEDRQLLLMGFVLALRFLLGLAMLLLRVGLHRVRLFLMGGDAAPAGGASAKKH